MPVLGLLLEMDSFNIALGPVSDEETYRREIRARDDIRTLLEQQIDDLKEELHRAEEAIALARRDNGQSELPFGCPFASACVREAPQCPKNMHV